MVSVSRAKGPSSPGNNPNESNNQNPITATTAEDKHISAESDHGEDLSGQLIDFNENISPVLRHQKSEKKNSRKNVVERFKELNSTDSENVIRRLNELADNWFDDGDFPPNDYISQSVPMIVTAASSSSFESVKNLIGSIQFVYEEKPLLKVVNDSYSIVSQPRAEEDRVDSINVPFSKSISSNYWLMWSSVSTPDKRPVLLFDIGLSKDQQEIAKSWENVYLIPFPMDYLPNHISNIENMTWKSILIYFALRRYSSVIYLDSQLELTNRLRPIEKILYTNGGFHSTLGSSTVEEISIAISKSLNNAIRILKLSKDDFSQNEACSNLVEGYIRNSEYFNGVLIPLLQCSWSLKCSMQSELHYESLLSRLVYNSGKLCQSRELITIEDPYRTVLYVREGSKSNKYKISTKKGFAFVVPFVESQNQTILENIELWSQHIYNPCDSLNSDGWETDLIFYSNKYKNKEIEKLIGDKILSITKDEKNNPILKCFNKVYFAYANLEGERDMYPKGPTNQFNGLLNSPSFYEKYEYFFYMEPDCRAIRPNWVDSIKMLTIQHKIAHPNFWSLGSIYRGSFKLVAFTSKFHINGNAIYSTSKGFRTFLTFITDVIAAFDYDIFNFLFRDETYEFSKHIMDRFVFHDFIQNWWHSSWDEELIRERNPRTLFIHGGTKDK